MLPVLPSSALSNASAAARTSQMTKYMPSLAQPTQISVDIPKVQFSKQQLADILASAPAQKPYSGFRAPSGGMFRTTRPALMRWSHPESPQNILKVPSNASLSDLKKAHNKAVMKYHPDVGGNPVEFRKAQEAFEYLKFLLEQGKSYSHTQSQKTHGQKTHGQKTQQTSDSREHTGTIHPRNQAPEGNWKDVGSWTKQRERPADASITWTRHMIDADGARWTETAVYHKGSVTLGILTMTTGKKGWEYTTTPDMGWHGYNHWYMDKQYRPLGTEKLERMLYPNAFKDIFMRYFARALPAVNLLPSMKKLFIEQFKKILENHFELLNMGRPAHKKFDPYNIHRSTEETQELKEATRLMKAQLYKLYPELQGTLNNHFKQLEAAEKINEGLNKSQGTNLSFSVNTATRLKNDVLDSRSFSRVSTLQTLLLMFMGYKTIKYLTKSKSSETKEEDSNQQQEVKQEEVSTEEATPVHDAHDEIVQGNVENLEEKVEEIQAEIANLESKYSIQAMQDFLSDLLMRLSAQISRFRQMASDAYAQKRLQALEYLEQWTQAKRQELTIKEQQDTPSSEPVIEFIDIEPIGEDQEETFMSA